MFNHEDDQLLTHNQTKFYINYGAWFWFMTDVISIEILWKVGISFDETI